MGLCFTDVAGAHCQQKTKCKRRGDIQNADRRDTREGQHRLVQIQLAVQVPTVERIAETCRCARDVAGFKPDRANWSLRPSTG
jgi:hypothetical protein